MWANEIQIALICDYCESQQLPRREWAKIWVDKYAGRCRELIESGHNEIDSIRPELYNR